MPLSHVFPRDWSKLSRSSKSSKPTKVPRAAAASKGSDGKFTPPKLDIAGMAYADLFERDVDITMESLSKQAELGPSRG